MVRDFSTVIGTYRLPAVSTLLMQESLPLRHGLMLVALATALHFVLALLASSKPMHLPTFQAFHWPVRLALGLHFPVLFLAEVIARPWIATDADLLWFSLPLVPPLWYVILNHIDLRAIQPTRYARAVSLIALCIMGFCLSAMGLGILGAAWTHRNPDAYWASFCSLCWGALCIASIARALRIRKKVVDAQTG